MGQHAVNYSRDTINRQFLSGEHKFVWLTKTSNDIANSGLTEDNAFHELDLVQYGVQVDAVAVLISYAFSNTVADKRITLSPDGVTDSGVSLGSVVANVYERGEIIVGIDNGHIDYKFQDANFSYYFIFVGYWV